jgi:3-hydroxybutyryl-CoA dehydrogenase
MTGITTVGVVGGGLMGSGIAQVSAQAGTRTIVREVSDELGARATAAIARSLAHGVNKGKLTAEERDAALGRIEVTTDLEALASCDIIVEAVVESLDVKNALWSALDLVVAEHTIYASNTSSLTIAAMAAVTNRPDRMVGLHFFNPVPLMPLVEVVRTVTTSEETVRRAFDFARQIGKTPVAAKDTSGFIVNRLLIPYLLDAIRCLESGVGSMEDIDAGMRLGTGHPMGPFTLCDFVGLDTLHRVAAIMYDEYREPRFAPPPLLKRMVLAGMFGRKSGKGFYDYSVDPPRASALGV